MPLTPEQEWILVASGLVAHADDVIEVGEWDQVLRLVDGKLDDADTEAWLDILADRGQLEQRFKGLDPVPGAMAKGVLERAWDMALADGAASEVEIEVHDRVAERLGVDLAEAETWRAAWNDRAAQRAELVVAYAAIMANLDGQLDAGEAAEFDTLLERMPVPVARRVELAASLHQPPELDELVGRLAALETESRRAVLAEIAPMVHASRRGEREKTAFMELAKGVGLTAAEAEHMLSR